MDFWVMVFACDGVLDESKEGLEVWWSREGVLVWSRLAGASVPGCQSACQVALAGGALAAGCCSLLVFDLRHLSVVLSSPPPLSSPISSAAANAWLRCSTGTTTLLIGACFPASPRVGDSREAVDMLHSLYEVGK